MFTYEDKDALLGDQLSWADNLLSFAIDSVAHKGDPYLSDDGWAGLYAILQTVSNVIKNVGDKVCKIRDCQRYKDDIAEKARILAEINSKCDKQTESVDG